LDEVTLDIVAIGHLINETIIAPGQRPQSVLGSPVAYSMACAAALGKHVGIVSRIGTDYPMNLLDPLIQLGVDDRGILQSGTISTINELIYDSAGNKSIRYLSRAPNIRYENLPKQYFDARILYVCPMDWEVEPATVEVLSSCPGLLAVDLGGFGGAHSQFNKVCQMDRDVKSLQAVVSAVDIVKASDEDCRRIAGDPQLDLERFALRLIDWGCGVAIITLGAAGALIFTSERRIEISPLAGNPVDPTGGGDTFMAGFLASYLDSRDLAEAGQFAAATALLVIEGTGGVIASRMPTLEMVRNRLKNYCSSN
jgi:sugar/nucleoside kinase (ribokinase family)